MIKKELKNKSKNKILYIPSWIDVDFKSPAQSTFTNFPAVISKLDDTEVGMIYAEMHVQQFRRRYIYTDKVNYPYLGMRAWTAPKRGRLWSVWLRKYVELYEKFIKEYWKPDIIHSHGVLAGVAANELYEKYKIPFVHTEHLGETEMKQLPKSYRIRYETIAKNATAITTVSRENRDYMEQWLKIDVLHVPNFVDVEHFQAKNKVIDQPVFISIGEPAHTKGLDILMKSFIRVKEEIPEAMLILVDKIRDRKVVVDPIVKKNKLKQSIIMTGIVDRQEIKRLLQSASVYVSASRHESFGMAMVEALASGTPVVATKTAGSKDILEKSVGLLVEQKDEEGLAKAMVDAYVHRKKYRPEKLHGYIAKKYAEAVILPSWQKIYQSV